ncbi:MAG: indole-3-glycerol phosphate synthase TrpC [Acidobacteria bacterium]|nr:indole-3-glycerol phosphate synthase TrpC [Acidobacteriota bacterium]
MTGILDRIVTGTRRDLDRLTEAERERIHHAAAAKGKGDHRFRRALEEPGIRIIAEIKAASPSAGTIAGEVDPEAIARRYAEGGAAALSVVTEPHHFRGSRDWIPEAKKSDLPVIMKDFVVDPVQIDRGFLAGADAILLLASILDETRLRELRQRIETLGLDALVEVHDEKELDLALSSGAPIVGVNNRNLRTFEVDLRTAERIARRIPPDVVMVAESGIHTRRDIERLEAAGYRAFLVGEALMRAGDPVSLLRTLTAAEVES